MEFTMANIEEKLHEHKYWKWGYDKHYDYNKEVDYEKKFVQTTPKWRRMMDELIEVNTRIEDKRILYGIIMPEQLLQFLNKNYKKKSDGRRKSTRKNKVRRTQ